jgi:hypothetical protein
MKVQYEEGPESLLIARAGVVAERGQAVEVPDEIGKLLLTQGWSQVGKSTPKKESN